MPRLNREQAEWLRERARLMMLLLGKIRTRLEKRGFNETHALYRSVCQAYNAVHGLHITAHYESCEHGVGRSPDDEN